MKEFIDKLISRFEEEKGTESDYSSIEGKKLVRHWNNCIDVCKEIADKMAVEYAKTPTPNHPIPIDTQQYIEELERKVNRDKLIEMYSDMVEKYKDAEESVIDEMSGCFHEDMDELEKECNKYIEDFKKLLDNYKTEDDWIPCSERYPDTDDYILLSFENFSVPLVGRYEEDADGGGAFYIGDDSESCISQGIIVNGWVPLMKCYREKGDEEDE